MKVRMLLVFLFCLFFMGIVTPVKSIYAQAQERQYIVTVSFKSGPNNVLGQRAELVYAKSASEAETKAEQQFLRTNRGCTVLSVTAKDSSIAQTQAQERQYIVTVSFKSGPNNVLGQRAELVYAKSASEAETKAEQQFLRTNRGCTVLSVTATR